MLNGTVDIGTQARLGSFRDPKRLADQYSSALSIPGFMPQIAEFHAYFLPKLTTT